MLKPLLVLFCFLSVLPFSAASAEDKPGVSVSIVPQKYFVRQIAGETVQVHVMVEPGASPATYEPRPQQMAGLSKTRAYFSIGVPFEQTWLPRFRAANPDLPVFPTQEGIARTAMEAHDHGEDEHGHGHHGEEAGQLDPHIWLSPRLAALQARNILLGLCETFPEKAPLFRENYRKFIADLAALDTEIMEVLSGPLANRQFLVFHPSWGYFAADYGLKQVAIEVEGKAPKQKDLVELVAKGRKEGWKAVFIQPQFPEKSARTLARDMGAEVIPLDPLAENWADNLREAAKRLAEALK
jgi:zinc transport system substrate-binding protein